MVTLAKWTRKNYYCHRKCIAIPSCEVWWINPSHANRTLCIIEATMQVIKIASKEAIPRTKTRQWWRPIPWWTETIGNLRKICLRLRHCTQRLMARNRDITAIAVEFKATKKELKQAIKASGGTFFRVLTTIHRGWGIGWSCKGWAPSFKEFLETLWQWKT